jgi:hypothetical protein
MAAGWQWKAHSDAGARTCNEQPEQKLSRILLLKASKKLQKNPPIFIGRINNKTKLNNQKY